MISSKPRRWSIKGIKSQILFNTNSLVSWKHLDKVLHFWADLETQLDEVQEQLFLFRGSSPRTGKSVLLGRNSVIHKSCRSCERNFEEEVRQLLEEKDQQGKQKKATPSRSSCQNPGSADPDPELLWRTLRRSASVWKKSSTWNRLKEQSFKEISEKGEPRKELADLWHHWEAKAQRWIRREEELEDTLQDKIQTICRREENKNQEEIQLKIIQIQLWTYGCHRQEWVERFFYNFMFG